jgi:peptidoglycan/xylan/chitin deacetylase (PgdA/CDA1 family)
VPDVLVLCYHAVGERWPSPLAITPGQLERQLRSLVRRGYRGATFTTAVTAPPAARTLAVTFDDGFRSVLVQALPVLERLALPATVFVPTDFVGRDGPMSWPGIEHWIGTPYEHELVPMSWDELRTLADAGWEIGSHTCSHARLSLLDDAQLARELSESRTTCEERLGSCRSLAVPYGDRDPRVPAAAARAGYEAVAALIEGVAAGPGWPRVGIYPDDVPWRFRVKVARFARGIRNHFTGPVAVRLGGARARRPHRERR